jgi:hemoglobin-like flavoprotein
MTPKQIDLVQDTFADIKPIAQAAAELFYSRLFMLDPGLRKMFTGDMAKQGQMLMSVLGTSVKGLRNLEALAPVVRHLGARHVGYGVKAEHYDSVGTALIDTLEAGLGSGFTSELRAAWQRLFEIVRCEMLASPAAADLPRRQAVPAAGKARQASGWEGRVNQPPATPPRRAGSRPWRRACPGSGNRCRRGSGARRWTACRR